MVKSEDSISSESSSEKWREVLESAGISYWNGRTVSTYLAV